MLLFPGIFTIGSILNKRKIIEKLYKIIIIKLLQIKLN